jgi:cell wall-associated NlpC family hydrolase
MANAHSGVQSRVLSRAAIGVLAVLACAAPPVLLPAPSAVAAAGATAAPGYLRPVARIVPATGCVVLTPGMNGVKVKLVHRRLGFAASRWETMDATTVAAVKRFQRARKLTADGVVGTRTWRAMGFRESFCLDRYQARPALPLSATPAQRRDQFIRFASGFLGEEYVWGGAGPRRYGIDCSGLVLQALYSAGLDPQPVSVDKHVLPAYRTSRELYAHSRLRHVTRSQARRGDLVFWKSNATGRVNHVAIYLGGGRVLEAVEPKVRIGRLGHRSTQTLMPHAVRPF